MIGHKYFHNWTGNRVTCRDWFQVRDRTTASPVAPASTTTSTRVRGTSLSRRFEYFLARPSHQLTLKEGLTVYRDQEFSGDMMNSHTVKRIKDVNTLRARQFAEDAGPMSHPIRPESYIR